MIEWKKEYETGNEEIDAEHYEIFNILNELLHCINDSCTTDIIPKFNILEEYTLKHFIKEEQLAIDNNYPFVNILKNSHYELKNLYNLFRNIVVFYANENNLIKNHLY